MLGSGCAEAPPQIQIKEVKAVKVAGWLMVKPKRPICEDAGKQDYEVPELELARQCYKDYSELLERRVGALQATIREREVEIDKTK